MFPLIVNPGRIRYPAALCDGESRRAERTSRAGPPVSGSWYLRQIVHERRLLRDGKPLRCAFQASFPFVL